MYAKCTVCGRLGEWDRSVKMYACKEGHMFRKPREELTVPDRTKSAHTSKPRYTIPLNLFLDGEGVPYKLDQSKSSLSPNTPISKKYLH